MSTSRNHEPPAGISPADIYFVFFRHKWKIVVLTLLGLMAAAVFYFARQPLYQSEAEVFIRYITDVQIANPSSGSSSRMTSLLDPTVVMNSEMAILTSYDLAAKVATNYGPDKILAQLGGGSNATSAAVAVKSHLNVDATKDSSVLYVTFSSPDPALVQPVLEEVIQEYQDKHKQVHSSGLTADQLSSKISQLQFDIQDTENQLRMVKTNAGIISIAETEKFYQEETSRIRRELSEARAIQFERQTSLPALAAGPATNSAKATVVSNVPLDKLVRYRSVCTRLIVLEQQYTSLIQQGYTDESKPVKENSEDMVAQSKVKAGLERQYPALVELGTSFSSPETAAPARTGDSMDPGLISRKIQFREQELAELEAESAKLNDAEGRIADLERTKSTQEANLKFYRELQNQAQLDESGPSRLSNISVIQQPSPPYKDFRKFHKTLAMLAISGFLIGLAWAFLIEFYLDRSVKRPVDLQNKLRIPFFLSIPDLSYNQRGRFGEPDRKQLEFAGGKNGSSGNGSLEIASPTINHALHSHYDALRDRLVSYFESINLTRKPKLVAITSTAKGAGVSTISAGLAASLSETGDGRVLLVDMNRENGAAQQFVRGKAECKLDDALVSDKRDGALVQENLYVVSEGPGADNLPRILPKRFASLVPKLKASDYDYIIFDMPPVTQTSITTRLAGFMDTVMLVVESEKTDRDVVQQANQLLIQSKANVSAVLNKTRKYVPAKLQRDLNSDV